MSHVGKSKVSSSFENCAVGKESRQFPSSIVEMSSRDNPFAAETCSNCAKTMENANEERGSNSESMEQFASTTTMHGVSFYYSSRSRPMKGFWIFLLAGMATMLTYQLVDRIIVYFQYETSTSITQEFVPSLPFPAVTICSFNRFYMDNPDEMLLNAIHGFNQLITPENVAVNEISEQRPNLTDISRHLEEEMLVNYTGIKGLEVNRLLKRYGFSLDSRTMPRCVFKYENCEPDDFSFILTWMGACHTFNNGNVSKIQSIPGAGHGFSATINIQRDLITEQPIVGLRDMGLRIQIHQRGDSPHVGSLGISIPSGTKASIEISRRDYNLMYRPWGRCDPTREYLMYFSVYTLDNCFEECYTNALLQHCGCYLFTQYWAEGFGRECTAEEMQDCAAEYLIEIEQNYSAETCNCTVPCSSSEYDTAVSYATFPNPPTVTYLRDLFDYTEDETYGNAVEFDIYYKTMSYTKFTQTKKVDESGLLSDMGGQLGLWLGMSIITAVEIVQFCAKRICGCKKAK